jgi:dienelactone hydrolase
VRRLGMIVCLVFGLGLVAGCGGEQPRAASTEDPALRRVGEECVQGEERKDLVTFPSEKGRVTGYEVGKGTVGVILAHQSDGDLCQWKTYATRLAGKGYRALAINFDVTPFAEDVPAAIAAMRKEPDIKRIFLIGASMGGTAVLTAAAQAQPPVAGVVSLSAPGVYAGMDAQTSMSQLTVPALFVAAEEDSQFATDTRELYNAAKVTDKKLLIVPGKDHGTALMNDEMSTEVEQFIRDHAG